MKSVHIASMVILSVLSGLVGAAVYEVYVEPLSETATDELIAEYYATEVAVHVSPHGLRKHMADGDDSFIIVDLRSQEEYESEHIVTAVNIPAYANPDTSAYGDVERIVGAFSELDQSKEIIVYCYSTPCMTGRKIGNMLAEHEIYVQHLGIGWNEWRYDWESWNHEHEWEVTDVMDYIVSGSEPGSIEGVELKAPACSPGESDLGC